MFRTIRIPPTSFQILSAAVCLTAFSPPIRSQGTPLFAKDFVRIADHGFGDRNNSWAQSMIYWNDDLYVGTTRQSVCTSLAGLYQYVSLTVGKDFADTYLPYPPPDPDLSCAPDWADLPLQAEIWRWSPKTKNTWTRVFQSPATLDNPGSGAPAPPRTGKKVPYEIAFRGFSDFTESDGTSALYAFGVNSTILWDRTKLPPPRILRTTDGVNWTPVPQEPGTFLGDLSFNPDHSSFRSPVVHNGKLFVLCGPVFGQGSLIGSANPSAGNNAWFLASSPQPQYFEIASFNGWLYLGSLDQNGYTVVKTRADGPPPYQFTTVVPTGAFLTDRPSRSVVSMHVRKNRLYVGTATFTEVIRINPDDTWDLIVGAPRTNPATGEVKSPISGLGPGFGHTLNDHAWQMEDPFKHLYIGTYNAATPSRLDPVSGPLIQHILGAHLYRTPDDWYISAVTTNGFSDPTDPSGGRFDYGFRTMAKTPHGFFMGTVNDYYGLTIFRARKGGPAEIIEPPVRLEIEQSRNGGAILSWLPPSSIPKAKSYEIWRAEILPILIRDDPNFEGWNGASGNKIPDTYIGPYQLINTTSDVMYLDGTVQNGKKYLYYVLAKNGKGDISEASNLVTFPLLLPSVTYAGLFQEMDRWAARDRFKSPDKKAAKVRAQLLDSQALAAACNLQRAINTLEPDTAAKAALDPESTDAEILFSKLVRRLQVYQQFPGDAQSSEFCSGSSQ